MNPIISKIIPLAKNILNVGGGLIKPLPLSGIVKEISEVRKSKFEANKVLRLVFYLVSGVIMWGVISGKINVEDALRLIRIIE